MSGNFKGNADHSGKEKRGSGAEGCDLETGNKCGRLYRRGTWKRNESSFCSGSQRRVLYAGLYEKNRPAWILSVICAEQDISALEEILFRQTTTIGIRRSRMERSVLKREIQKLSMPEAVATVKICTLPDGSRRCYPEYESAAALQQKII